MSSTNEIDASRTSPAPPKSNTDTSGFLLPPQRAFNALCHSTHLYGRRLVLEWADSEVTLQAMRRKTAEHYHGRSGPWGLSQGDSCIPERQATSLMWGLQVQGTQVGSIPGLLSSRLPAGLLPGTPGRKE